MQVFFDVTETPALPTFLSLEVIWVLQSHLRSLTQISKGVLQGYVFKHPPSVALFINLTSLYQFSYSNPLSPESTIPFHIICYFLSLWGSENFMTSNNYRV